ncbi:MAG: ABC transporter permease [Pseudomonadota bacterium]
MGSLAKPGFELDNGVLRVTGDWTVETIGQHDNALRGLPNKDEPFLLDVSGLGRLDTAGAYLLDRTVQKGCGDDRHTQIQGEHPSAAHLLEQVYQSRALCPVDDHRHPTFIDFLARFGEATFQGFQELVNTLSFIGQTIWVCFKLFLQPGKLRWTAMVSVMEEDGIDAIPIVLFLNFFVGMVIAFIGATTLAKLAGGAEVFTVELVGIATLREFGVVITAIILAGRSNSAITAQIGAMGMRQEIDAMRVLGMEPMAVLVAPRVLAMLIMVPILSFFATLAGIFGGLVVCWAALDIAPILFANRFLEMVAPEHFWVGMSKAPVFAIVLILIACRQGLLVRGSVQSLGNATTASVVQAIFSIIVLDAMFALFYLELDV